MAIANLAIANLAISKMAIAKLAIAKMAIAKMAIAKLKGIADDALACEEHKVGGIALAAGSGDCFADLPFFPCLSLSVLHPPLSSLLFSMRVCDISGWLKGPGSATRLNKPKAAGLRYLVPPPG